MDENKIRSVLLFYEKFLSNKKVENKIIDINKKNITKKEVYDHLFSMIIRAKELLDNNKREKVFRWLGFIQGVLWITKDFSLKELKEHSKPDNEK